MKNRNLIIAAALIAAVFAVFLIARMASCPAAGNAPVATKKAADSSSAQTEGALISVAGQAEKRGDLLKAREAYQKLIEKYPSSDKLPAAQEALENLNIKLLFSQIPTSDSAVYTVEKGDSLIKIAKKFNTTSELIARANNLRDGVLRIGKNLKISKARFSIVVDKSQNILTLKSGQDIFKTYRVATGRNSCTPVGAFKINNKIVDPPWYPPTGGMIPAGDPKNVLGSRWLGITKQGYGIHGTTQPESIGQSVTEGCVRMKNQDVEELYAIVPVGTEVVIVD